MKKRILSVVMILTMMMSLGTNVSVQAKASIEGGYDIGSAVEVDFDTEYLAELNTTSDGDYYKFTAPEDAYYNIHLTNEDADYKNLILSEEYGEEIDRVGLYKGETEDLNLFLYGGETYTIRVVASYSNEKKGMYSFSVVYKIDEEPNSLEAAKWIGLNEEYIGEIDGINDKDYFCFYGDKNKEYNFKVTNIVDGKEKTGKAIYVYDENAVQLDYEASSNIATINRSGYSIYYLCICVYESNFGILYEGDKQNKYQVVITSDDTSDNGNTTSFGSQVSGWAKEEVEEAYDENLVPEVLVGEDLTQKIDRAEFAAIAVALYENLTGSRANKANNPFNDIYGNACQDDILKAYNLEITVGTSATTFEPNINITREQMATMLTRAYKKSEFKNWTIASDNDYPLNFMGVQKFADDNDISGYAKESVYFMARWDIIKGVGNNKFAPKNSATFGEAYGYATREQAVIIALRSAKHL